MKELLNSSSSHVPMSSFISFPQSVTLVMVPQTGDNHKKHDTRIEKYNGDVFLDGNKNKRHLSQLFICNNFCCLDLVLWKIYLLIVTKKENTSLLIDT